MSEVITLKFGCDGCGKQYPWKPELTNKKAKCKCGKVLTVPDLTVESDDPPPLPDDGILDYVDNAPEIASSRADAFRAAAVAPVVAVAAPAKPRSPVLGYRQGPTARDRKRAGEQFQTIHDLKRDVYAPTALLVGSFAAYFAWLFIHGSATTGSSIAVYGVVMTMLFAVKTVLMIGGAFIVASLASVSFGPFWTAILKLAAVATAPDIFATILEQAIGVPGASMIAGALALAYYWFLISWLFSMDASEAWGVVVLFGALRWILTMVLSMVVLGMVMSGGGSSLGNALGGSSTPTASQAAVDLEEQVDAAKDNDLLIEGQDYIDKTGRHANMGDTIKNLYAAGAKHVWFQVARDINGKKEALSLIAEWPRDEKKRAAMLAAIKASYAARAKEWADIHPKFPTVPPDTTTDEGGKYVEIGIGL